VNQLGEWKVPFALVFTKADKSTQRETARNVQDFLQELSQSWEEPPPHFVTSAIKGTGGKQIRAFIAELNNRIEF